MAKKILIGVLVGLVALVAFNYFTTGRMGILPSSQLSAEGRALDRLEERFVAAMHRLNQAGRTAGMSGMDTTADAQAAIDDLNAIERELEAMKAQNPSSQDRRKIDELISNIRRARGN
jgi:hypothetical protein